MTTIIDVTNFGAKPEGADCTLAIINALEVCRTITDPVLRFPKGDWHFYPTYAVENNYAISNNTYGLKRCALPIIDFSGLTIEGEGSTFFMHGILMGVIISNSKNIVLRNFSIDWQYPFYSQGEVTATTTEHFDINLSNKTPWELKGETLWFAAEGWTFPFSNFLEFDSKTRSPAYRVKDNGGSPWNVNRPVKLLPNGNLRIYASMTTPPKLGNLIVIRSGDRYAPGIFFEESINITCEKLTVHHASGMGFIAQKCENITLRNCAVTASLGRIFSACADATHFAYCRGLIQIENCTFENQLDDPINIHGIYIRVKENLGNGKLLLQLMHESQVGVNVLAPGERVQFINHKTLLPINESIVQKVLILNAEHLLVTFDHVPKEILVDDCIENLAWVPDVIIRGCKAKQNRARGILITTAGKVLIENNFLSTSGTAIKISADANRWYESGQVRNVLIRNNHFVDCLYCDRDNAVIDIDPEIHELGHGHFHHNIRIENNHFQTFDSPLLFARSVDGLIFKNNTLTKTNTYTPFRVSKKTTEIIDCINVEIKNIFD